MKFISVFITVHLIGIAVFGDSDDCIFKDSQGSNYTLDLSELSQSVLTINDSVQNESYSYTPCRNGNVCPKDTIYSCMVSSNIETLLGDLCTTIAWWNSTVRPYYNSKNRTWVFKYENAECIGYYPQFFQFFAYYHCNPKAGSYKVQSMYVEGSCLFEMHIDTQFACV